MYNFSVYADGGIRCLANVTGVAAMKYVFINTGNIVYRSGELFWIQPGHTYHMKIRDFVSSQPCICDTCYE